MINYLAFIAANPNFSDLVSASAILISELSTPIFIFVLLFIAFLAFTTGGIGMLKGKNWGRQIIAFYLLVSIVAFTPYDIYQLIVKYTIQGLIEVLISFGFKLILIAGLNSKDFNDYFEKPLIPNLTSRQQMND